MKSHTRIPIVILLILFQYWSTAYSQTQQYRFEHIGKQDGLSSNSTTCILKDSKDFLWFGTQHGLNQYNGNDIKVYLKTEDTTTLTSSFISTIYEDSQGTIWVGTIRGLNRYCRELDKFDRFTHDPEDSASISNNWIMSIYQDIEGEMWIGTQGGGLNRFNKQTESFTRFRQYLDKSGEEDRIEAIYEDEGFLWLGTHNGIFIFNKSTKTFQEAVFNHKLKHEQKIIHCISQDNNKKLYFGSLGGLIIYDKSTKEVSFLDPQSYSDQTNIEESEIESMAIKGDELWMATWFGLDIYNTNSQNFLQLFADPTIPNSISTNFHTHLFLDYDGFLWIATRAEGINKLNTKLNPFHQVRLHQKDVDRYYSASSFCMDKNGNLWVGAYNGGLFKFDNEMNLIGHFNQGIAGTYRNENLTSNNIIYIYEDSNDILWISIHMVGMTVFDRTTEEFIPVPHYPKVDSTFDVAFTDILEDSKGRLWFVDGSCGLYIKQNSGNKIRRIDHNILSQGARFVFEDSKADIWVGTVWNGLFCLKSSNNDSMNFIHYKNVKIDSNGFHGKWINSINEDVSNNIWLTTGIGLNLFDQEKNKFYAFEQNEFLYGDQITYIFGDNNSNLWFIHNKHGLTRFNPSKSDEKAIKVFSINDGMPFENFQYMMSAVYQSTDGRIFVGSTQNSGNGFFFFNPDSITENTRIPRITITDCKVKNDVFQLDTNITEIKNIYLKHNQNYFSFEFAALDYTNPEKNQYAYYLEGLEDDWTYSGTRRFANYTGVPPGDYVFRVKGSNNDGYWNEEG
ncbi:MAG: hypothetical protein K8R74_13750, partial [Bacteroidales bacterium]|nr:hypothetical protein [Bacteroidales bacterium]